jgi:dienelactone hydrolase
MNFKNQILGFAAVTLLALSSCKKDIVTEQQAANVDPEASNAVLANNVVETAAPSAKGLNVSMISNSAGYYEVLPARYSLTTKTYPLILFIHGIGELGTGVGRLVCCGIPNYASKKQFPANFNVNGQNFSFIVVAPQFKVRPSAADMQNCIAWATKHYRVDPTRIYITGLSMGGGSTWDYISVYGQNVAAAVPVAGGSAPTTTNAKNIASKNLPVWTICSKTDAVVPISWGTNWVNWIKSDNPANASNVNITVYTGGESHNTTWFKAFNPATYMNGVNIYQWMLKYRRTGAGVPTPAPTPAPPTKTPTPTPTPPAAGGATAHAGTDVTIYKRWNFAPLLNGTRSTIPGGWFTSMSWTKVGGPSTYKFANGNASQTRVSFTGTGVYTFRLTVKTNKGATATDDVVITVK